MPVAPLSCAGRQGPAQSSLGRLRSSGVGNLGNIGSVDSDIVQLPVGIVGKFAHDVPVHVPRAEVLTEEGETHVSLHSVRPILMDPPRLAATRKCANVSPS